MTDVPPVPGRTLMPGVESAAWLGKAKTKTVKISELDSSLFVTKEEAAKILKVQTRQVERLAQQGRIEKRYLPRKPNEKAARVVYSRADIEAVANREEPELDDSERALVARQAELAKEEAARQLRERAEALMVSRNREMSDAIIRLADALASLRPLAPPSPFLTLDAAAEYSGLPRKLLRRFISRGLLYAVRHRKTFYVKRETLNNFEFGLTNADPS